MNAGDACPTGCRLRRLSIPPCVRSSPSPKGQPPIELHALLHTSTALPACALPLLAASACALPSATRSLSACQVRCTPGPSGFIPLRGAVSPSRPHAGTNANDHIRKSIAPHTPTSTIPALRSFDVRSSPSLGCRLMCRQALLATCSLTYASVDIHSHHACTLS